MLAAKGKKVLLIDLDAQANLTSYLLGYEFEADNVFNSVSILIGPERRANQCQEESGHHSCHPWPFSLWGYNYRQRFCVSRFYKDCTRWFLRQVRLYPYRLSSSSWRDDRKCDCGCRLCRYSHNRWTFRSERVQSIYDLINQLKPANNKLNNPFILLTRFGRDRSISLSPMPSAMATRLMCSRPSRRRQRTSLNLQAQNLTVESLPDSNATKENWTDLTKNSYQRLKQNNHEADKRNEEYCRHYHVGQGCD